MVFFALLAVVAGGTLVLMLGLMGLAEAPWPVLVGILAVALVGLQRTTGESASAPTSAPATPPTGSVPAWSRSPEPPSPVATALTNPVPAPATPQLVYRGVPYAPKSAVLPAAPQTITLEGTYRGRHWQKSVPAWPTPAPLEAGDEVPPAAPPNA